MSEPKKRLDTERPDVVTSSQRQTILNRLYEARQALLGATGQMNKTIEWLQKPDRKS